MDNEAVERVRQMVDAVESGNFDAIEEVADKWIESAGIQRMSNAISSVFESHAPQEIMDRFRQKVSDLMHLAFTEGAAQGVLQIAPAIAAMGREGEAVAKPWENFNGPLPDYDHPMRCVFESGIQYAVELLAKTLNVEDYDICDGTEEFDGDLSGTLFNIVLAAMPQDEHGDPLHPEQVRELYATPPAADQSGEVDLTAVYMAGRADLLEENRRLREALRLIEKGETEVFDEGDTEEWVTVSMDMDEASRIATVALLNCTCMEVFGEDPNCVAHGRAALSEARHD
ncbi:MAG: hypothetical protein QM690_17190 [Sphingobium sp.]